MQEIKEKLDEKKMNSISIGDDMINVIDEEEYRLIDQLKLKKANYKENLDKFKAAKAEMLQLKNNIDLLKLKLVEGFENWFQIKYKIKIDELDLFMNRNKYKIKDEELMGNIIDPEEIAYHNAKKKIQTIHKAKKMEKMLK
jgi:hypothetical protein